MLKGSAAIKLTFLFYLHLIRRTCLVRKSIWKVELLLLLNAA